MTEHSRDPEKAPRFPQPRLDDPGTLLANLPALFGYYPSDSLVLVTFSVRSFPQFELGPALRIDLGDFAGLHAVTLEPGLIADADLVFSFIIGAGLLGAEATDPRIGETLAAVEYATAVSGTELVGCWTCDEIVSGGPYQPVGEPWEAYRGGGRIAHIASGFAMEPWLAAGQLPELSRQDAFDRFAAGNPVLSDEVCRSIHRDGKRRVAVYRRGGDDPAVGGDAVTRFVGSLEKVDVLAASGEELYGDREMLGHCATVLSLNRLRDAVVAELLARPAAGARIMMAAARSFRGRARADALSLFALAAIADGLHMTAVPAVITAQEEMPEHHLSKLIFEALQVGGFEPLLEGVSIGSSIVRAELGLDADPGGYL